MARFKTSQPTSDLAHEHLDRLRERVVKFQTFLRKIKAEIEAGK